MHLINNKFRYDYIRTTTELRRLGNATNNKTYVNNTKTKIFSKILRDN